MPKRILLITLSIILLSSFIVCMSINTAAAASPSPLTSVPSYGGTLNISMRPPKTLNPLLNEDTTVDAVLKLIFEPLAVLDANQKPHTNMAASLDFASDGMSVVITLLDTIKWNDGTPITSADLIFSLETIQKAPDASIYKDAVSNISDFRRIDSHSVKINYSKPSDGDAYLLCFPLIPEHYYKNANEDKNMHPLGNGVYTFESYTNMKSMALKASENSFRKKPYIENIEVRIIPNTQTELYAFDHGIIDVVSVPLADWGKYRGSRQINITEYITSYYDFVGFNYKNMIFHEKAAREAVAYCLNIKDILENIYLNHAIRAYSPFSPAAWLYESPTEIERQAFAYDYSLEKAKELIASLESHNPDEQAPIKILVNEENAERQKIATSLSSNLKTAGLYAEVVKVPFDEYEIMLATGDFDIIIGGYNLSVIPDPSFAFHSSSTANGQNFYSYKNNTMDALLSSYSSATGENNQKRTAAELQQFFAYELPCISIAFRKSAVLTTRNIHGEIKPVINNIYANIHDWFIVE